MDYLAQNKEAILQRFQAGMSIRRLHEIYGGSTTEIEKLVKAGCKPGPQGGVFAEDFSGRLALTSKELQLFEALPSKVQKIAFETASKFGMPVIALFQSMGKKQFEKRARGCFFNAIETQLGWSYRKIAIHTGWSRSYVITAISTYITQYGA